MDNKKWYKRLNTVFWWLLSALPLFVLIYAVVGSLIVANNDFGIKTIYENEGEFSYLFNNDWLVFDNSLSNFMFNCSLPFLRNSFTDLFKVLFNSVNLDIWLSNFLVPSLAWFVSVHIYHLIVDVLVWLPNMLHKLIDKYQD